MKVKAYVQFEVVLIRVSMTRELNCYAWLSMRSFLSLNRCRVVPLYREENAQQPLESRPAHKSVRLGLSTILALHYKSTITMVITTGFKPYPGLSPSLAHYLET